jgi:hypothetical protein
MRVMNMRFYGVGHGAGQMLIIRERYQWCLQARGRGAERILKFYNTSLVLNLNTV